MDGRNTYTRYMARDQRRGNWLYGEIRLQISGYTNCANLSEPKRKWILRWLLKLQETLGQSKMSRLVAAKPMPPMTAQGLSRIVVSSSAKMSQRLVKGGN